MVYEHHRSSLDELDRKKPGSFRGLIYNHSVPPLCHASRMTRHEFLPVFYGPMVFPFWAERSYHIPQSLELHSQPYFTQRKAVKTLAYSTIFEVSLPVYPFGCPRVRLDLKQGRCTVCFYSPLPSNSNSESKIALLARMKMEDDAVVHDILSRAGSRELRISDIDDLLAALVRVLPAMPALHFT